MEFAGLLSFIGLFVLVLSALVGVAYYSLQESSEGARSEDGEAKKSVRKTRKRDSSKKKADRPKKRKNSGSSTTEHVDAPEEEPIVIIPDPFTNKLSSRFAGAQPKKPDFHKKPSDELAAVQKTTKAEVKSVKPQATVKPSKAVAQPADDMKSEQKAESAPLDQAKLQVQTMVAQSNEVEKLNMKIREMDKALNEKLANISQVNRQNEELRVKLDDAKKMSAKIQSEFDAQKQTNQIIQKELTRLTGLVSSLDKEKLQLRHEIELARVQQSKPVENVDVLMVRIEQLSNELVDRNSSHNQLKSKNQELEARLADFNEQNANLFNRLQTQEALTKQLEIKLERSVPVDTFKQKDVELNNLRIELKSLQSQSESMRIYGCQKDSEVSCLRSKIDELSSKLQQANANDKSAELQMFEARIKDYQGECDQLRAQNSTKDNQLAQLSSELEQHKTRLDSLEDLNSNLKSQLDSTANTQAQSERTSEQLKNLQDELSVKNGRIEVLEKELSTFGAQIDQESNKLKEQIHNLRNELDSKNARCELLQNELGQLREKSQSELAQSRDQLNQKEAQLESLRSEMNKISECGNQNEQLNERIRQLESSLSLKQTQLDESFSHVQLLNTTIEEKENGIGEKQRQLDESFNHVQHLNHVIGEKQRQLDESFNHVQHLNHVIGEKQHQLDESFSHVQHLNTVLAEKDARLSELNQVEQQVGQLSHQNEVLKQQIQSLEHLNSKIEQLSHENEELKTKNLSLTSTLTQTAASLNCLEEMIMKREANLTDQIKKKDELIQNLNKKNESNGHKSEEIYHQLEEIKRENQNLKMLLEEEIKSSKANLTERAKIRDLIKIGQDALEHEKLELLERIDTKVNGSNGH